MVVTRTKTDEVLASARKDVQAQLAIVRDEIGRLAREEQALTQALSSLGGDGASSPRVAAAKPAARAATRSAASKSSRRKAPGSRSRRAPGASKSTAERVNELRELLAAGPKSKKDLATALKVSSPRVQQLLAELGSSVSSQPDPAQRQGKLWSLKGADGAASAAQPAANRRRAKTGPAGKSSARRKSAAK